MLNIDSEALKGVLKAIFKGQCGGNKCDEGALKGDRAALAMKNDEKALSCDGKVFNFNIINVER